MKAFLLAAGHGTRLRPLTDTIPKCLVPICGTPMLDIWLDLCSRSGIDELLLNLHAHAATVRAALQRRRTPVKVTVVEEDVLLGSAGTLAANCQWVHGEKEFWVLYADVLTTADLSSMLAVHRTRKPAATIGLYRVKDPSRCGIVACDQQAVVREFVEKPEVPRTDWAFSGLMIATPELLQAIPPHSPVDLGYDVLPKLTGRMIGYQMSDYLIDIGTLENYHLAQSTWPGLTKEVRV